MSVTVSNNKNELLCYDEKNPIIFSDRITAIHYLQKHGYEHFTNEDIIEEMNFNNIPE